MAIECDGVWGHLPTGEITCTGTIVDEPSQLAQLYELLNAAFSTPTPEQITTAFMAAVTLPLIFWLVSFAFGSVVNFIRDRDSSPEELD